jgi:hypothetical protein
VSDLVTFLRARLDEDEAEARATADADAEFWADIKGDSTHFARHDPARVLREVAAGRAILALARVIDGMASAIQEEWPSPHVPVIGSEALLYPLAAVYSDHPDYDEAWRP